MTEILLHISNGVNKKNAYGSYGLKSLFESTIFFFFFWNFGEKFTSSSWIRFWLMEHFMTNCSGSLHCGLGPPCFLNRGVDVLYRSSFGRVFRYRIVHFVIQFIDSINDSRAYFFLKLIPILSKQRMVKWNFQQGIIM